MAGGGQNIGLHGIVDIAKVAAGCAIAINIDGVVVDHAGYPLGDYRCVCAVRVLPFAKHIKVAQANAVKAVAAGKHIGIEFVNVFGDSIGRQGFADLVFYFG